MKILFFTTEREDYLQDSILHGLRNLFGSDVIDYPQKKILYKPFKRIDTYGRGFTLYNLLDNIEVDRNNIEVKLKYNIFDLVIFGSIQRQNAIFLRYNKYLNKDKTLIFDGEDTPALFSYHGYYWRKFSYWFLPRPNKRFIYFKREWTPETKFYRYYKLIPKAFLKLLPEPKNLRTISFSIPEDKIVKSLPVKTKLFPKHIVDPEVAAKVEGSVTKYAFENEADYYSDLQSSKFGITTKRSGWDCMRHYEIAANGAVICFKDLDKKPVTCAPQGLVPGVNCISYKNYDDLMNQISKISDEKYTALQAASLNWIKNNTTINTASKLIENFNRSNLL